MHILISTFKTGGLGLNLTMASKVLIMEPWWNEACEEQAFARVYRPGQLQKTECARILLKGTMDDRVVERKGQKSEHFARIAMKQNFDRYTFETHTDHSQANISQHSICEILQAFWTKRRRWSTILVGRSRCKPCRKRAFRCT